MGRPLERFMTRLTVALILTVAGVAAAEEWPGWRGPRADGTSIETGLPVRWGPEENVRWKSPVPGVGHSSPVVWGDRIFLTSCRTESKERLLLCYDRRDGKPLWDRIVLTAPLEKKHEFNSYASSTPATDGRHVWVSFLAGQRAFAACYDVDGAKVWEQSPGEFHSVHGYSSPAVLFNDLVILNEDQDDPSAYLVALDKATGKERWRVARPGVRSYCPPLIVTAAGRTQMVMSGSDHVTSYDPATGTKLWEIDGPTQQFVASFVFHDGLLFMTGGFPERHVLAIRPDGHGDVTATHIAWRTIKGAGYVPSPVARGHHVFLINDDGVATCWEAATGKQCWQERLGRRFWASPITAEGRVYATSEDGTTTVFKAAPTFEVIAKDTFGEDCFASPAVSGGNLFYRTAHHLWCIGK
jgi:outer membrane protein assembly factor BamB